LPPRTLAPVETKNGVGGGSVARSEEKMMTRTTTFVVTAIALLSTVAGPAQARPRGRYITNGCYEGMLLEAIEEDPDGWDECLSAMIHGELGSGPKTTTKCEGGRVYCCYGTLNEEDCEELGRPAPDGFGGIFTPALSPRSSGYSYY
jgi:hypothetical protein